MTIVIQSLSDASAFRRYEEMRNTPRRILENGVHPNGEAALSAYETLMIALSGGHEATEDEPYTVEDMSAYAEFHENTLSQVAPFVAAMQACMETTNATMHIVNLLSAATNPTEPIPFSIPADDITVPEYLTILSSTIATLQATQAAMTQAAMMLQGGGE